jgi:adenine C2-methylase RlmN of 23S rRNA A2503 and tRNA A37
MTTQMDKQLTVSEVIKQLQAILEKHGDVKVYHVEFGGLTESFNVSVDIDEDSKEKIVVID